MVTAIGKHPAAPVQQRAKTGVYTSGHPEGSKTAAFQEKEDSKFVQTGSQQRV